MSETIVINLSPEIFQQIEDQFGIKKSTILRAIAIKSVGLEHTNTMELAGAANKNIFPEDIQTVLPNSRLLFYFGITFAVEPKISLITKKGGVSKTTNPLTTITLKTNGLYQFDIVASNKLKYNLQATLVSTFLNMLVIEYTLGL